MLLRIAAKLGIDMKDEDPSIEILEKAIRPDKLVEQIERAHAQSARLASALPEQTG